MCNVPIKRTRDFDQLISGKLVDQAWTSFLKRRDGERERDREWRNKNITNLKIVEHLITYRWYLQFLFAQEVPQEGRENRPDYNFAGKLVWLMFRRSPTALNVVVDYAISIKTR